MQLAGNLYNTPIYDELIASQIISLLIVLDKFALKQIKNKQHKLGLTMKGVVNENKTQVFRY